MYGSVRRQLMQEYVQKSIRTTLPRRPARVSGSELSQLDDPVELGRRPEVPQSRGRRRVERLRLARAGQLLELALRRAGVLEPLLQRLRVAGYRRLEVAVDAERDRERGHADEHARRAAHAPARAA